MSQEAIVSAALRALLYEVTVNPKPGLVDPVSNGPHPDMNAFMFIDSAVSLRAYFEECARLGTAFTGHDLTALFAQIRPVGVQAEKTMFQATRNTNTHKGAIFSLGILVTAAAYQGDGTTNELMQIVRQMLTGLTKNDFVGLPDKPEAELTAGERQFLKYGIKGIRGESEAGYPTVMTYALPELRQSVGTINQRLLDVLLTIVRHSVDTNLVKRAKSDSIIDWAHDQADRYFEWGGSKTAEGMTFLHELNATFTERHLSLGGSADLLILTIFLGIREGILIS
ncbi:triphosphoribosyl-dephospho-CoA synthase [Secundilactobacillus collinoides]|uniref:Probable 2-(5''-triphosphoribosyl)-3'-dephosphocoenzyme-A synthase n=1 Tax=Secundilactobacillus collinoides TaxID=33960 RepID=A0A166GG45_SECCO|nr:triphosphoribosyl-dephospho-CoA synthase [Secundilactobacillus collinoides]KZL38918.1 triphosphoribosyl-dephospho-CoA synthase [Secundilactobacillus collinoides]